MNREVAEISPFTTAHEGEQHLVFLTLDEDGHICSSSGEIHRLTGYASSELSHQHISMLFPRLKNVSLLRNNEINPKLRYLFHLGFPFKLYHRDHDDQDCRLSLIDLANSSEPRRLMMIVSASGCPTRVRPAEQPLAYPEAPGLVCEWQQVEEAHS